MAKKKKGETEQPTQTDGLGVDPAMVKEFGDGIFVSGKSIAEKEYVTIPISPAIDMMLGGGIPEGSFCIATGSFKLGKTTCWLHVASQAQKLEYTNKEFCPEGRHVYFFNIEGRLQPRDLKGIKSLNTEERFTVIQSAPGDIKHAEEYLDILERLIHTKPGCVFIVDSFSQLCSGARATSDYKDRFRDDVPLMLANFCKRISNVLPVNKSILLGVTHKIANQSPGAKSKWMEASGQKIQYQLDVKLEATHRTFQPEQSDNPIGQIVHWKCHSSPIGPPGRKADSLLRYGHGIDCEWEFLDLAADIGMISKGGAWYTFPNQNKEQGKEKAAEYLRQNPEYFNELYAELRKMLGLQC